MLNVESYHRARRAFTQVNAVVAQRRELFVVALLTLSAGCGANDNIIPSQFNPVLAGEAGFPAQQDAGFLNPVFQPPPGASPGFDAGPNTIQPGGPVFQPPLDAGFSPRDAGSFFDAGPGTAPTADGGGSTTLVDPAMANPCGTGPEPLAANIRVTEISIYQTVKVPLFKDGNWLTMRNAVVVQGKKSLIRAFVAPQAGFSPHALRGATTAARWPAWRRSA
jgi:hypothetical protein